MRAGYALVLALVVRTGTQGPAEVRDGTAELQGRWELVSVEREGRADALGGARPRLAIAGDQVRYGGEVMAAILADPAVDPKMLDLRFLGPIREYEGIYTIDDGTLKICLNGRMDGVKERPHAFTTKGKDNWRLLVFRRVEGADAESEILNGYVGLALGVEGDRKEVVVVQVLDDGPARGAGLRNGDVLLEIAGVPVTGLQATIAAVRMAKPGSKLAVRIRRDGKEDDLKIQVALRPFASLAGLD